jgi:hypothetical protein
MKQVRLRQAELHKVIANEFMSLDGVAQAPGGADEDTSGGFAHGGWHREDELVQRWLPLVALEDPTARNDARRAAPRAEVSISPARQGLARSVR